MAEDIGRRDGVPLPRLAIDTGALPGRAGFTLWQEELVPYWESRPHAAVADRFHSAFESYLIGDAMLGRVRTPAQRIDRSRHRIARDGFSQYGLKIVLDGSIGARGGQGAIAAGDMLVTDLAQPQMLEASDLQVLFLVMPRRLLAPLLDRPDGQNQRVLSGREPLAGLLRTHLATLYEFAPGLDAAQAEAIMRPTLALAAAALNGGVTEREAGAVRVAAVQEIRGYIEAHLRDPGLGADGVAARFGLSRRKLYYLFQPFGGFAAYVQERRLHRVRTEIADPALRDRSLAHIAENYGFGHYPSFVRAFRRAFAMSPREVRALGINRTLASTPAPKDRDSRWSEWLFRTR